MITSLRILFGLRTHDLRAARTYLSKTYAGQPLYLALPRFLGWASRQIFATLPRAMRDTSFARPVSRTSYWLARPNPLEDHPWKSKPSARLPEVCDTVVIGAGFTGAAAAYFWSRRAPINRSLVVVEMGDAATGASGRNAGTVVMGRYFALVHRKLMAYWRKDRAELDESALDRQARQFTAAYVNAAYRNADLIEKTIQEERIDCGYHRQGWVQAQDLEEQESLRASVALGAEFGFTDWVRLSPAETRAKCGLPVACDAGFSRGAATFDPVRWVWSLLEIALRSPEVRLFSRTRVLRVVDAGSHYEIVTSRGTIRARHVINATESYTALLHRQFHGVLRPVQSQAAYAQGGPAGLHPHVAVSSNKGFFERTGQGWLFGSDETPVPDSCAGQNQPSRFITQFLVGYAQERLGEFSTTVTHEWSATAGFTADEYPVVGVMDGKRQYVVGGMCGSGTGVAFNAGRCLVNRILGLTDEPDDYPPEFFAPSRLLDPRNHAWPEIPVVTAAGSRT